MTHKEITKKRILPIFRHYLQGEIIPRNPSREKNIAIFIFREIHIFASASRPYLFLENFSRILMLLIA